MSSKMVETTHEVNTANIVSGKRAIIPRNKDNPTGGFIAIMKSRKKNGIDRTRLLQEVSNTAKLVSQQRTMDEMERKIHDLNSRMNSLEQQGCIAKVKRIRPENLSIGKIKRWKEYKDPATVAQDRHKVQMGVEQEAHKSQVKSDTEDELVPRNGNRRRRRLISKKKRSPVAMDLQAQLDSLTSDEESVPYKLRKKDGPRRTLLHSKKKKSSIPDELKIGPNPIVSDDDIDEETDEQTDEETDEETETDEDYALRNGKAPVFKDELSVPLTLPQSLQFTELALFRFDQKISESNQRLQQFRPPCFFPGKNGNLMMTNVQDSYPRPGELVESTLPGWSWWYLISRVPPVEYNLRDLGRRYHEDKFMCVGCGRLQPITTHFDIKWRCKDRHHRFCAFMGCCCAEKTQTALMTSVSLSTFFSTTDSTLRSSMQRVLEPECI